MNIGQYVTNRAIDLGLEMTGYRLDSAKNGNVHEFVRFGDTPTGIVSFSVISAPGENPRIQGDIVTRAPDGPVKIVKTDRLNKAGRPDRDYIRAEIYKGVKNISGSIGKVKVKK